PSTWRDRVFRGPTRLRHEKSPKLTLISFDSLVRIEPFQGVARTPGPQIFSRPLLPAKYRQTGDVLSARRCGVGRPWIMRVMPQVSHNCPYSTAFAFQKEKSRKFVLSKKSC